MKVYTRTGDQGTTSLFTGQRVPKNNLFIEALGTVDEANSTIGLAISFLPKESKFDFARDQLVNIQHALFDVGAALATPRSCQSEQKLEKTRFGHEAITQLEKWMDKMEEQLPPLHSFILPGGHQVGAFLNLARSIVRRAERLVIPLYSQEDVTSDVLIFLNRLSDYLFVLSRYMNQLLNVQETKWQPHKAQENQ